MILLSSVSLDSDAAAIDIAIPDDTVIRDGTTTTISSGSGKEAFFEKFDVSDKGVLLSDLPFSFSIVDCGASCVNTAGCVGIDVIKNLADGKFYCQQHKNSKPGMFRIKSQKNFSKFKAV